MRRLHEAVGTTLLGLLVALLAPAAVLAYSDEVHQELTFLAAKQLNRCLADGQVASLGPLEVRYVVRRNVSESARNAFRRLFQWRYYDRHQRERTLLGLVETRLHEHYNETVRRLLRADSRSDRYGALGTLVHYLQQVTVPATVVPILSPRFWRLTAGDQMDEFPLDSAALERELPGLCAPLFAPEEEQLDLKRLLVDTAERTRLASAAPIPGTAATWAEFWKDDADPSDFGEYGAAGNNFGRAASFPCGPARAERCQLVDNDSVYREFANQRHRDAVLATMRAMLVVQRAMDREIRAARRAQQAQQPGTPPQADAVSAAASSGP